VRTVTVQWQGMRVEAARPEHITSLVPELSAGAIRRTERAAAAVRRAGDRAVGALEVAARLLLRTEGLASSAIEGLRASAGAVALAEATGEARGDDHVAAWVADNLAVVSDALADDRPLTSEVLFGWHVRLMRNSRGIAPAHVGAYRDTLGWVGGPNPRLAAHVAAPPELVPELMDDLYEFVARTDLDPVTHAAIAHAQFETIHPFADGNGRLGRVLVGRMLSQELDVAVPPPVSLQMARDAGGYQAGLTLYRQDGIDTWVGWFADIVAEAADRATDVLRAIEQLQEGWRTRTADLRADAGARRLLDVLPAHPVVSAASVAALLGVSEQAARVALDQLARRGVLVEVSDPPRSRGRPRRWWVAQSLLDLLGG
jgi:Fic family protein